MGAGFLTLIVLAIGAVGYFLGRQRSLATADGDIRTLHSLPSDYGQTVFIFAVVPALLILFAWLLLQPLFIEGQVSDMITEADIPEGGSRSLVMADVRRIMGFVR